MERTRGQRRSRDRALGNVSIRVAAAWAFAALVVFVLLLLAGAVGAGHILRTTTVDAAMRSDDLARIDDILVRTLTYRRVADLEPATSDPELASARAVLRDELFSTFRYTYATVDAPEERARLRSAERDVRQYVTEREALSAEGLPLEEVVRRARPPLDRATATLSALRAEKRDQLTRTNQAAYRATAISDVVSFGAVLLLIGGGLIGARYVSRRVVHPLVTLEACMDEYRKGERGARAPGGGARELDRVARAFNDMADELESQRDRQLTFLAGVAHDLNNPLSAIRLGVYAVKEGGQSPAVRDRTLALLDRQVDRLTRIVKDLLDATRIEAGRLQLEYGRFDVREAVWEVVGLYGPASVSHELAVDAPQRPVEVEADPVRVEQVLANLVSNAIKFSPEGGRIDVRVDATPEEVVLEVRDRGIGIAPDAMDAIFAPFHRSAPDIAPGTGLGLSVVRRIVQGHGGAIAVDSEPGRGSTFRVRLPRSRPTRAASPRADSPRAARPTHPVQPDRGA